MTPAKRIEEASRLLRRANSAHDSQLDYIRALIVSAVRVLADDQSTDPVTSYHLAKEEEEAAQTRRSPVSSRELTGNPSLPGRTTEEPT